MRQPPKTNAQRQRRNADASKGREVMQIEAYLAWQRNPCGKPALILGRLERQATRLVEDVFIMGVDSMTELRRNSHDRRAALCNLEGAVHANASCPPLFGYFEGWAKGGYVIEVYGRGERWTKLTPPPRPALMDAVKGKDGRTYVPVDG